MPSFKPFPFVVRDPLLGDLRLTEIERLVLDSDAFQRQRGIKQLGTSLLVYPSAMQTRFVHALGNLQIMGEMIRTGLDNADSQVLDAFLADARKWFGYTESVPAALVRERVEQVARLAGMLHDLGHFPMSHVFEYALKSAGAQKKVLDDAWDSVAGGDPHEYATLQLLRRNGLTDRTLFDDSNLRDQVADVIEVAQMKEELRTSSAKSTVAIALAGLVSSEIDSDRAEYLRRDNYVSGAGYGQYDIDKLTQSFLLIRNGGGYVIRPSARALQAIESFLVERVHAYQHLYYHGIGVLMDNVVERILRSVWPGAESRPPAVLEGMVEERAKRLEPCLALLAPDNWAYSRMVTPAAYVDDATLWEALRSLSRALDGLSPLQSDETEAARLMVYLRVLLRREHLWAAMWKRAEDYRAACDAAIVGFRTALVKAHQQEDVPLERLLQRLSEEVELAVGYAPPPATLLAFNALAHIFPTHLPFLAAHLESLLNADQAIADLRPLYVELGSRHRFKPLRNPRTYQVVSADRATLVPLIKIAPASVAAIQSLWHEGIQVRLFVLSLRGFSGDARERLRSAFETALPDAITQWYGAEKLNFQLMPRRKAS